MRAQLIRFLTALVCATATACAPQRPPVPPGTIPEAHEVSRSDEQYGHEVLAQLSERYPLDRNDERINRVRDIVDRLTAAANASAHPWHVYVLVDDNFKNAAATRGHYIFVWTGILNAVRDDDELATILAHEIGHVLAGHTAPDPHEETNRIIAGVAGTAVGSVLAAQGQGGILADLADMVVRSAVEGLIVNPSLQANEFEADHIGLFLMADAGYDPGKAVSFWERIRADPEFAGFPVEFLSSHPSSEERFTRLEAMLPEARARQERHGSTGTDRGFAIDRPELPPDAPADTPRRPVSSAPPATWVVLEDFTTVYAEPAASSPVLRELARGTEVEVRGRRDRWLRIAAPVEGFVRGRDLAPVRAAAGSAR